MNNLIRYIYKHIKRRKSKTPAVRVTAWALVCALIISALPVSAHAADRESSEYAGSKPVSADPGSEYVSGEALVLMDESSATKGKIRSDLKKEVSDVRINGVKQDAGGEGTVASVSSERYGTDKILEKVSDGEAVKTVEPNYIYRLQSYTKDSLSHYQWYLGDRGGIDLPGTGSTSSASDRVVAVLDTGVDASNPDLASRIYGGSSVMYDASRDTMVPVGDDEGHGTHVAGIIAAVSDNSEGIGGISDAEILPVKVIHNTGTLAGVTTLEDLVDAYRYVIQQKKNGVNICAINLSLGGLGRSAILDQVIEEAGNLGILTIAAAGNDGGNDDSGSYYPASSQSNYVISVGASASTDTPASFSNYGRRSVDMYAPGTDIMSTSSENTYIPEENHSLFYQNFEEDYTDTVKASSGTTVKQITGVSFMSDREGGSDSRSLLWEVDAAAGGDYALAIPYTLSGDTKEKTQMGIRTQVTFGNHNASTSGSIFTVADAGTSGALDASVKAEIATQVKKQGTSLALTETPDYWDFFSTSISDGSTGLKKAGTVYYLLVYLHPASAGRYYIKLDNMGAGYASSDIPYRFMTGSSMAAPMAAGEAAVLSGLFPGENALQIKARMLSGTDVSAAYSGRCTTSGRADLAGAVSSSGFLATSVTQKDTSLVVQGLGLSKVTSAKVLDLQGKDVMTGQVKKESDSRITVDVKGLKHGTYELVLGDDSGHSINCGRTVNYVTLALNRSSFKLAPKKSYTFRYTFGMDTASAYIVRWKLSGKKYASFNSATGKLTAKKKGNKKNVTLTCTVTASDGSFTVSDRALVKIRQPVKKISLDRKDIYIRAGESVRLKKTISPKNAASKKVTWKSSKKKYATVTKKGTVKTKLRGRGHTVTITCRAKDGSGRKAKCRIHIN